MPDLSTSEIHYALGVMRPMLLGGNAQGLAALIRMWGLFDIIPTADHDRMLEAVALRNHGLAVLYQAGIFQSHQLPALVDAMASLPVHSPQAEYIEKQQRLAFEGDGLEGFDFEREA
jgi:hypothetical protein